MSVVTPRRSIVLVEGMVFPLNSSLIPFKGPVKLIKRVKIAHSFSQSVSNQFHVIILNLPMQL